jgi:hypothetical protein
MAGDMLKSTYDTDNDGIVDTAEAVPYSGITGLPDPANDQAILSAQVFG